MCNLFRDKVLRKIGEDWIFLTLLGITMALLSFLMDYAIEKCQEGGERRKFLPVSVLLMRVFEHVPLFSA